MYLRQNYIIKTNAFTQLHIINLLILTFSILLNSEKLKAAWWICLPPTKVANLHSFLVLDMKLFLVRSTLYLILISTLEYCFYMRSDKKHFLILNTFHLKETNVKPFLLQTQPTITVLQIILYTAVTVTADVGFQLGDCPLRFFRR